MNIKLKEILLNSIQEYNKYLENKIENYNPSCRSCNSSKSTFTLENWRKEIELKKKRIIRDSSTFRILQRFKLINLIDEPVNEFYNHKVTF